MFTTDWARRVSAGVGSEATGGPSGGREGVPTHQGTVGLHENYRKWCKNNKCLIYENKSLHFFNKNVNL